MNNHLNMLPKKAKFNLKCSKMRWRLGRRSPPAVGAYDSYPDPLVARGFAPSALANTRIPSCESMSPRWLKSCLRACHAPIAHDRPTMLIDSHKNFRRLEWLGRIAGGWGMGCVSKTFSPDIPPEKNANNVVEIEAGLMKQLFVN